MGLRVSLFVTCIVDQFFPRVGMAMAETLERLGCTVDFPEAQTCCGQPAFNSGYRDEARGVAAHFLDTFDGCDYIVASSGSCTSMVTHHYEELFTGDAKRLEQLHRLAPRVFEYSQFLTSVLQVDSLGARFPHKVTYHDGCHALRELKIKQQPRQLLSRVEGLQLIEMEPGEECCGFGGTFSVKFAPVSSAMAETKIDAILRTGAEYVVSADSSCLMQIEGRMRRDGHAVKAIHLAEVLASR